MPAQTCGSWNRQQLLPLAIVRLVKRLKSLQRHWVHVVGFGIVCLPAPNSCHLPSVSWDLKLRNHVLRDIILQVEDTLDFPIVIFCSEMAAGQGVDELRGNTGTVT
jgi:hypothetical protein